jgi:phage tail sheath protein FI
MSMLQFKSPGIYTQEVPSGSRTVATASTSVTLFVGPTKTGIDNRAIRIRSLADYERLFGPCIQTSNLSYSIAHFFDNGGSEGLILRVPAKGAVQAKSQIQQDGNANVETFTVTALSSGAAGNDIFVEFDPFGINAKPFDNAADKTRFNISIFDRTTGTQERFGDVSTTSAAARCVLTVINDVDTGSGLVSVAVPQVGANKPGPQATGTIYNLGKKLAAGKVAADVTALLSVAIPGDDGKYPAAAAINQLAVTIFKKDEDEPTSAREFANRLASALNAAIRGDVNARAAMAGVAIEAAAFGEGIDNNANMPISFIRLRTAPPNGTKPPRRVHEATITLEDPQAGTKLLNAYTLAEKAKNPSRYALGLVYDKMQVLTAVAGADGDSSGQPDDNVFKNAISGLDVPDPFFDILCLPDIVRPKLDDPNAEFHSNVAEVYAEAARICENKFAFLLVDPSPYVTDANKAGDWKSTKFQFNSDHAAAYFPNIRVNDPLSPGMIRSHPPSGAIAGAIARTDARAGPWEAPAGTDAFLASVYGPSVKLSDADQGDLNVIGLNCIRQFPIYQTVIFGSRTVSGSDVQSSDYKYIPVRRTALLILKSLTESLRWAVHRGNGEQLWAELRIAVTAFMQGLFKQGAFKGATPKDAYFVTCDSSTTSPADIANGIVNIVIGYSPLKPSEFVVITLKQIIQPAA